MSYSFHCKEKIFLNNFFLPRTRRLLHSGPLGLCSPRFRRLLKTYLFARYQRLQRIEQLYSPASDREINKQKTVYNKHQNAIDMQDYQAYVAYKINRKQCIKIGTGVLNDYALYKSTRDGHGLGPSMGWVGLGWVEFSSACDGLSGLG